jgi:hypothetical protein
MALDSEPGYGAYKSLEVTSTDCAGGSMNDNGKSLDYLGEYGETYIVVTSNTAVAGQASLHFSSTCVVAECLYSQYMGGDGTCQACPAGSVSTTGSTMSIDDCVPCPGGLGLSHPKSSECVLSTDFDPSIATATGWRLWTPEDFTLRGWTWDIRRIRFYASADCSAESEVDTSSGTAIDSGNAGNSWVPSNAFGGGTWGGRRDDQGIFWIGMDFADASVSVRCVVFDQVTQSAATELRVQAKQSGEEVWRNVWIAKDLVGGENEIRIEL